VPFGLSGEEVEQGSGDESGDDEDDERDESASLAQRAASEPTRSGLNLRDQDLEEERAEARERSDGGAENEDDGVLTEQGSLEQVR
jgi:hypothetical protein